MKKDMKYKKFITLGIDRRTGQRVRKHIYGNSESELHRNIAKALNEFEKESQLDGSVVFKSYADHWISTYKAMREAATVHMYENALSKTGSIDYMYIKDIQPRDIQRLINANKEHPTACAQLHLTLNQIFKHAIADNIINSNPVVNIELPKKKQTSDRALRPEELTAIKNADLPDIGRIYILLLFYFGLRPQEALALMPSDFDFDNNILTIKRAVGYDGNNPYIKSTKTYKPRKLPIPTAFLSDIKSYIEDIKSQNSPYLIARESKLMTKTVKSDFWLRIKAEINRQLGGDKEHDLTDGLRPYTFRHNFCCECYYRKLSILKCAELMGNSPQMVMKVYTHLDNEKEPLDDLVSLSL